MRATAGWAGERKSQWAGVRPCKVQTQLAHGIPGCVLKSAMCDMMHQGRTDARHCRNCAPSLALIVKAIYRCFDAKQNPIDLVCHSSVTPFCRNVSGIVDSFRVSDALRHKRISTISE